MPPAAIKSKGAIFSMKVSQGQKVIYFDVIWKGFINGVCMLNNGEYEESISYGSKVIVNIKVANRQTDRTKTISPKPFDPGA